MDEIQMTISTIYVLQEMHFWNMRSRANTERFQKIRFQKTLFRKTLLMDGICDNRMILDDIVGSPHSTSDDLSLPADPTYCSQLI